MVFAYFLRNHDISLPAQDFASVLLVFILGKSRFASSFVICKARNDFSSIFDLLWKTPIQDLCIFGDNHKPMKAFLDKILSHPSNQKVLDFLKIDQNAPPNYFKPWEEARFALDEGATIFFDQYGAEVPEEAKCSLGHHNLMVNEETGEIFAFHTGRFSIFFRCDFERSDLENDDTFRRGDTFDCISDITSLEENWSFLNIEFEGDEVEQFKWAYELIKKK